MKCPYLGKLLFPEFRLELPTSAVCQRGHCSNESWNPQNLLRCRRILFHHCHALGILQAIGDEPAATTLLSYSSLSLDYSNSQLHKRVHLDVPFCSVDRCSVRAHPLQRRQFRRG